MEACVECKSFNESQLQDAMGALERGEQGAEERVEAIQRQSASPALLLVDLPMLTELFHPSSIAFYIHYITLHPPTILTTTTTPTLHPVDSSWWRTAVWYARRKHISQCRLQTEENRARAQELLDRNAQSNRRAEQKRKDREKDSMKELPSQSSSSSYYYKDYVAPVVLEWVTWSIFPPSQLGADYSLIALTLPAYHSVYKQRTALAIVARHPIRSIHSGQHSGASPLPL